MTYIWTDAQRDTYGWSPFWRWFLIEPDGTAHEMIWFNQRDLSCAAYARYSATGEILHRLDPGGAVVKGNLPFSRIALGRGDAPHRMGLVFKELGTVRDDTVSDGIVRSGAGSDGQRADFTYPRYGQWFRLSSEAYQRLSADADFEQQWVLDAAREYGFVPYDRGGYGWAPKVGMIAGADWAGSTVGDLRIRTRDLERVTVGAT